MLLFNEMDQKYKIKIFNNKIIDIENLLLHVYEIVNTIKLVLIKKEQE